MLIGEGLLYLCIEQLLFSQLSVAFYAQGSSQVSRAYSFYLHGAKALAADALLTATHRLCAPLARDWTLIGSYRLPSAFFRTGTDSHPEYPLSDRRSSATGTKPERA